MTGTLYVVSQATLVTTAPLCNVITVKTLATLLWTILTRFPNQEHHVTMTCHASNHITTRTIGTDPSLLTTYTAKERHFDWSRSHHWSHHGRSPSNCQRYASCSPSHHHSSLQYPSTKQCSRQHFHWDTIHWHNCNLSKICHFSNQSHSQDYSIDQSWSSSRHSLHTPCRADCKHGSIKTASTNRNPS